MYAVDVVEALVKLGTIDLNAELHNTTSAWLEVITPVNLASIFGHYDILKVLVAAGAELRLHDVNRKKYFIDPQIFSGSPNIFLFARQMCAAWWMCGTGTSWRR